MIISSIRNKQKKDLVNKLEVFISELIEANEILSEKLSGYEKEEEIAKLINENNMLRRRSLHILTDQEEIKVKDFSKKHWNMCNGNTSYSLIGTGIGTVIKVKCSKCNIEEDITDVSNW